MDHMVQILGSGRGPDTLDPSSRRRNPGHLDLPDGSMSGSDHQISGSFVLVYTENHVKGRDLEVPIWPRCPDLGVRNGVEMGPFTVRDA